MGDLLTRNVPDDLVVDASKPSSNDGTPIDNFSPMDPINMEPRLDL